MWCKLGDIYNDDVYDLNNSITGACNGFLHVSAVGEVDLAHLDGLLLYVMMGLFQVYEGNGLPVMETRGRRALQSTWQLILRPER